MSMPMPIHTYREIYGSRVPYCQVLCDLSGSKYVRIQRWMNRMQSYAGLLSAGDLGQPSSQLRSEYKVNM
jgi:hypothetical protein